MSWWTPPTAGSQFPSSSSAAPAPPATGANGGQSFMHPSLMDDSMDEPETAPNHLPGYLTASLRGSPKGVHASPELSHQQPSGSYSSRGGGGGADRGERESWLSSSGGGGGASYGTPSRQYSAGSSLGGGLPSPSASRFGTGGLFDRSPTMSMALTVSQLDQQRQGSRRQHGQSAGQADDDDDEWGPPVMSIEDGGAADGPAVWDPASSAGMADAAETYQTSLASLAPTTNTQVIIFGPPPALHPALVSHFSTLGPIAHSFSDPAGGNWLTATFHSELDARRAVARSGEVLGGGWMVGVKWADPLHPSIGRPSPSPAPAALSSSPSKQAVHQQHQQQPSTPRGGGGPGNAIGTPLQLAPASSAFRRLVPSQTTPAAGSTAGRDRALVDAAKGGAHAPAQGQQAGGGGGGYLGKLGELVFGF